jgi:hypothetical protein
MFTKWMLRNLVLFSLPVLSACATIPSGPNVLVLPAQGKPFEQFQVDDAICRQWAGKQVGMSTQDVTNQNTATGAVVGTVIGAGAGALLGAASGDAGAGAAIGAGSGLLVGTAAGSSAGQVYGQEAQQQYDYAYVQCMYAKGNQVPTQVHQYRVRRISPASPTGRSSVPPDYLPPPR